MADRDQTVTFVADWREAHSAICDCCAEEKDVLTFNADVDHVVDLCRTCALALAAQTAVEYPEALDD